MVEIHIVHISADEPCNCSSKRRLTAHGETSDFERHRSDLSTGSA